MTTYYIKKIKCNVETSQGDGAISEPPFFRLYNASTQTAYIPNMINTTQHCYTLMEETSNMPFLKGGYGTDVTTNRTFIGVNRTTGQYMVMGDAEYGLVSNDYGNSWYAGVTLGDSYWMTGGGVSYSGQYMFFSDSYNSLTPKYHRSSDYGVTWSTSDSSASLRNVCMSSDGSKVVGIGTAGNLYRSTNYGASFSVISTDNYISDVSCSSDGTIITYTVGYRANSFDEVGYIFVSTNSGSSFTQVGSNHQWSCVCMSDDGSIQYAGYVDPGDNRIYKSTNSGTDWSSLTGAENITGIACTSDGSSYEWVGLLHFPSNISISGDGEIRVKIISVGGTVYNFNLSSDSGSNYSLIGLNKPRLYEINDIGGEYELALDLTRLSYYLDTSWLKKNWSTPYSSEVYDEDSLADQMCQYFEDSKYKIEGSEFFNTINLYYIVCTVNGDDSLQNIRYIPIFYFGNNPSDADRTEVIT
jgi:hypothetical protein